jgi:3-oxoacyl-(acyl-carrier-protein) synthase
MTIRIAITGVGAVTPAGAGMPALWEQVRSGVSAVRRIDHFDPSPYRCQVAGQSDGFVATDWLPARFVLRTDRFTHLAMVAAGRAIDDARLVIGGDGGMRAERVAVMVGNVLGGWQFAERELRNLWTSGPRDVSPYQATAWFPAAPQGNICIKYGIKGRAHTFVCDRASGAYALAHAADTISRGQADVVLAGGTEQPLSPYAWLCCQTSGYLTSRGNDEPAAAYRPFDSRHSGGVIGEGSVFLILENLDHAEARGARIYAELTAWAVATDGYMPYYSSDPRGTVLARLIRTTLQRAGVGAGDLGCIVADGSGLPHEDAAEVAGITAGMDGHARDVPVTAVKAAISHLMGAAAVADVAVAAAATIHREVPPVANLARPASGFELDFVTGAPRQVKRLDSALVISRGLGGINACLVVARWPQVGSANGRVGTPAAGGEL